MKKLPNKTRGFCLVLCLIGLFIVIGIAAGNQAKDKTYNLIFIPKAVDQANSFWSSLIEGAKMASEENGVKLQIRAGKTEEDYEYQNKLIEEAIKEQPDALLVSPCSYTKTAPVLKKAKKQGVKVILIDSEVEADLGQPLISTDNVLAGTELGRYAASLVDDDSQIAIVGHVKGTSTAIQRERGVRKGLGKHEKQIAEVVFCGSSYERAYQLTTEMVKKFPELDMIVGLNEYSALGVARAIEDLGIKNRISVVGFDSSIEQIQLMEKGVFKGVVIQKPFNMGYLGIEEAIKMLDGKSVQRRLDSGCKLITMENLYEEENQKLLYPFVGQ